MHAEHDIIMANPSVCLCVCPSHSGIVSKQMHISTNPLHRLGHDTSFLSAIAVAKFRGKPLQWGEFSIFVRNRRLSLKRYEIGPSLLWITNRKS